MRFYESSGEGSRKQMMREHAVALEREKSSLRCVIMRVSQCSHLKRLNTIGPIFTIYRSYGSLNKDVTPPRKPFVRDSFSPAGERDKTARKYSVVSRSKQTRYHLKGLKDGR